jgi:hypothetical protein
MAVMTAVKEGEAADCIVFIKASPHCNTVTSMKASGKTLHQKADERNAGGVVEKSDSFQ